ncbi:MAG TPA: zinc-dependent metalloprotease, partial [Verrucomicrobiae bacterium]
AELKNTNYKPRLADDRVGHFLSVQADFSSDHPKSLMVRRINRWNLQKKDPKAAMSEPVKPITYWLENTIPVEYRPYIREGALMWNKAFERIGFTNAIVVRQQADNSDWDPADARYSTIRWFQGADAGFAIGPSRANPFTGEIYDADISFSEEMARYVRRYGEEFAGPVSGAVPIALEQPQMPKLAWSRNDYHACEYVSGMIDQAAFGVSVLQARGALSKEMEEKLIREYLVEVTAHEVGHTLGLRHNFRASSMLKPEELFDDSKTDVMSQSGSVMDYNPIIIAPKGKKQGHFCPPTLGPYDYWAIEYAYKPIEGDEAPELAKIAARCAEPELAYATDEDALGTLSPASMDPLVNQFDQSSDPIGYYTDRAQIVRELWTSMENNLLEKGQGYQILRRAMNRSFGEYSRGILIGAKFIGGVYHRRDHFGDPNGRTPYAPVAADKQRQALEFLQRYAFSENAFDLPPTLLNRLAMERLPGVSGIDGVISLDGRNDYAWIESILNLHRALLARLYTPLTLGRLQDNEMRFTAGEKVFTMADMFAGLDSAIWSELDNNSSGKITALRRNLQREQLKQLVRLTVRNIGGVPEDATSLARASLTAINVKIKKALDGNSITDVTSRAHLQESLERITAALDARIWRTAE